MSFEHEQEAFRAFMEDVPAQRRDAGGHLRHARGRAACDRGGARSRRARSPGCGSTRATCCPRSRAARRCSTRRASRDAVIVASGDLDEERIARLVAAGAPIDRWGVGTDLGTSRDSPAVGGVYKLVADRLGDEAWRGTSKLSPGQGHAARGEAGFAPLRGRADGRRRDRRRGRAAGRGAAAGARDARGRARERRVAGPDAGARRRAAHGAASRSRCATLDPDRPADPYPVTYSSRLLAPSS